MTPVEVAGAYTAFATVGTRAEPVFLKSVVSAGGNALEKYTPTNKLVLDPRVAYLVDSVYEGRAEQGHRRRSPRQGIHATCRGKNGHLARRLVRRLHQQSGLRHLDRL